MKPEPGRVNVVKEFQDWASACEAEAGEYHDHLANQIKFELQDVRAFLEVVKQRDDCAARLAKAKTKADKWRTEVASGSTINDKQIQQKEADLASEDDLKNLLEVLTKMILGREIQGVWSQKIKTFRKTVLDFATAQLETTNRLSQVWQSMLSGASAQ
eukprot:GABV01000701.1.p1 GENE.GABV01000701.1~~GABV01000701.1.p1  ORF type:complete len:158 (-),score=65.30 GABV01000701.1:17-490(-)